jgi:hypothetical protein
LPAGATVQGAYDVGGTATASGNTFYSSLS